MHILIGFQHVLNAESMLYLFYAFLLLKQAALVSER
jgi:hypothetical protein